MTTCKNVIGAVSPRRVQYQVPTRFMRILLIKLVDDIDLSMQKLHLRSNASVGGALVAHEWHNTKSDREQNGHTNQVNNFRAKTRQKMRTIEPEVCHRMPRGRFGRCSGKASRGLGPVSRKSEMRSQFARLLYGTFPCVLVRLSFSLQLGAVAVFA